jgi:hypothetical protein
VGGDDHGRPRGGRLFEQSLDHLRVLLVDCGQGFVRQKDAGAARQRSSHGDALPFAGRQLARVRLPAITEPKRVQGFERTPADSAVRDSGIDEHQGVNEVLERVQSGQEALLLVDERNLAADAAEASPPPPVQASPLYPHLAFRRTKLAVDEAEQGRFSSSAWSDDLDQLAGCDGEVDV